MTDASDIVPGLPELGEIDEQDYRGDLTSVEKSVLPRVSEAPSTNKGEVEKLARFFSELPGPAAAKENFFGFISHVHQYGFFLEKDIHLLLTFYEQAESAYINSVASWEWTREHTLLLNNVKVLFYSIVRGAIGTKEDITNQRTALNEMSIKRSFSEGRQKKKSWFFF